MPDLLLFIPTESLSIDQSSNRLSLFNVLEQVNIPQFPALLPQICIVTLWQKRRDENDGDIFSQTLDIRDPEGTALCPVRRAQFQMPKKRHRLVSIIGNIPIHRAGQHDVLLYCHPADVEVPNEEHLLRSFPIEVQQVFPLKLPSSEREKP